MTKKELYKVTDILNEVLSNYLRGGEAEEVIAKLEESVEDSELIKEEPISEDNFVSHEEIATMADKASKECGAAIDEEFERLVVSEEGLEEAARKYAGIPEDSSHDLKYCVQDKKAKYDAVLYGANLAKQQMLNEAVDGIVEYRYCRSGKNLFNVSSLKLLDAAKYGVNNRENVKLILIKNVRSIQF